jgi:hypothetical protein
MVSRAVVATGFPGRGCYHPVWANCCRVLIMRATLNLSRLRSDAMSIFVWPSISPPIITRSGGVIDDQIARASHAASIAAVKLPSGNRLPGLLFENSGISRGSPSPRALWRRAATSGEVSPRFSLPCFANGAHLSRVQGDCG